MHTDRRQSGRCDSGTSLRALRSLFPLTTLLSEEAPGAQRSHCITMTLPYRDINIQAASDSYIFSSPSSPNASTLSIDRPTGDIRLSDASLLAGKRVSRVSSIAGILGMIRLRLGTPPTSPSLGHDHG